MYNEREKETSQRSGKGMCDISMTKDWHSGYQKEAQWKTGQTRTVNTDKMKSEWPLNNQNVDQGNAN